MSKSLVSLLVGIVLGYAGVRLITHAVYLTIIAGLITALVLK